VVHALSPTRSPGVVVVPSPVPSSQLLTQVLSYVCWRMRMLTHADVCWRMRTPTCVVPSPVPSSQLLSQVLSYVCWRMRMLTYADCYMCVWFSHLCPLHNCSPRYFYTYVFTQVLLVVCWRMLTILIICWRMLTDADECWRMQYVSLLEMRAVS
jgi:hypothetical protein